MDNPKRSGTVAAVVAIVLALAAVAWGGWKARALSSVRSQVDFERLRNEQLLSEKLQVEKNLASMDAQFDQLVEKNETLTRQLEEAKNLNGLKDASVQQLQQKLAANRKTYNELVAQNREMETKLASLNEQIAREQNERLAYNQEVETLRATIDNLKRELAMANTAHYDKVLVESTRGKTDKIVAKAGRTKKLRATVLVPAELRDVQFQIFDPNGKLISSAPENGTLAVRMTPQDNNVASTSRGTSTQLFQQAEMTYLPKKKLVPGTYRIEVLKDNLSIGSLQVRLR